MASSQRDGFWLSLLVHGAAVLAFMLMIWVQERFRKVEELHVFELTTVTDAPVEREERDVPPTPEPQPRRAASVSIPRLNPVPDVRQPDPEPEPEPEPAPTQRRPEPTPRREEKPEPRPEPKPRETISIEEFRRAHGTPKPQQRPQQRRPVNAPSINTAAIRNAVNATMSSNESSAVQASRSAAERRQIDQWAAEVLRRLKNALVQPPGLGARKLVVRVEFTVSASGAVSGVRVLSGSGEPELDAAVRAAFAAINPVPRPPTGQGGTWKMAVEVVPE